MGARAVIGEFTMADVVTVPSHLSIPEVRTYMTVEAARDLAAADTPAPAAVDEVGRSAQTFVVDVVVRSGGVERRAVASGRDIYAVSAPLAVEAVHRILTGRTRTVGVASAGAIFDAPDFLRALPSQGSPSPPRDQGIGAGEMPRRPARIPGSRGGCATPVRTAGPSPARPDGAPGALLGAPAGGASMRTAGAPAG